MVGLGNPGPEYDATRHNVGWWLLDRLAYEWDFPIFEREGRTLMSEGQRGLVSYRLLKPTTFMNQSGRALSVLGDQPEFDIRTDLLIAVDDAALDVGRVRFRAQGSPWGHTGLLSISGAVGSNEYPRVRSTQGLRR